MCADCSPKLPFKWINKQYGQFWEDHCNSLENQWKCELASRRFQKHSCEVTATSKGEGGLHVNRRMRCREEGCRVWEYIKKQNFCCHITFLLVCVGKVKTELETWLNHSGLGRLIWQTQGIKTGVRRADRGGCVILVKTDRMWGDISGGWERDHSRNIMIDSDIEQVYIRRARKDKE